MNVQETRMPPKAPSPSTRIPWRWLAWGAALALLLTPWVAMQFTTEVQWTLGDFLVFGTMIAAAGGLLELATRATGNLAIRVAMTIAVLTGFLLLWIQGAVGIFGA